MPSAHIVGSPLCIASSVHQCSRPFLKGVPVSPCQSLGGSGVAVSPHQRSQMSLKSGQLRSVVMPPVIPQCPLGEAVFPWQRQRKWPATSVRGSAVGSPRGCKMGIPRSQWRRRWSMAEPCPGESEALRKTRADRCRSSGEAVMLSARFHIVLECFVDV